MANEVAIGWDNRIDTATLSSSGGNNALNIENLKTHDVRELWTAEDATTVIKADFGSLIAWGGVALINTNAVPADTMRVRLSTVDPLGTAGDAYDSGTIGQGVDVALRMVVHFPPTWPRTGRYLRVDLTQASPPEIGRAFSGPVWFPTRAFSYGWRPLWRDASRRSESLGQVIHIDRKIRQRGFGFILRGITESEAGEQVHEINRICGTSRDVLVCRDISNGNLGKVTMWGLLEQPVAYPQEHPDHFVTEFELYERI